MPDTWNAAAYRDRATAWQLKAEQLPEGPERDTCLIIADGYAKLAQLLDARVGNAPKSAPHMRLSR